MRQLFAAQHNQVQTETITTYSNTHWVYLLKAVNAPDKLIFLLLHRLDVSLEVCRVEATNLLLQAVDAPDELIFLLLHRRDVSLDVCCVEAAAFQLLQLLVVLLEFFD